MEFVSRSHPCAGADVRMWKSNGIEAVAMVSVVSSGRRVGVFVREVVAEMSSLFILQIACWRAAVTWVIECVNILWGGLQAVLSIASFC